MITPFKVHVEDKVLADLRTRLGMTRWPDEIGGQWQYGSDLAYMRSLCDYWANGFDWRTQETRLNSLDHFSTEIDGRRLHFIHQRSPHPDALPLVMTHGWPGSIAEFLRIVPMLTEPEKFGGYPADAFHLICPSIPGYGFSTAPREPGFDQKRVAEGHVELMRRLGYERYGVQGGDWGSPISSWTAVLAPEAVCGLHLTLVFAGFPKDKADPFEGVTAEEKTRLEARRQHMNEGTGYQAIQGTRPQTLGYALNDSPAGLAAWITEKFYAWTDSQGDLDATVNRDDLLTNIMLYWINENITASMRLYYESAHVHNNMFENGRIKTPTGCAMFPGELYQPPRAWAAELYNIVHWTTQPRGGHFAALEVPELLAADVTQFFKSLR